MKLEKISDKPDRAGRYRLRFDDGSSMVLYRRSIEDLGLFVGQELDTEQMAELRRNAGEVSAKMRAVRIVAASNVSQKDLQQRLIRKGEDPRQAEEAVRWMTELDLVDDARTARQVAERCAAKGYGLARAKQALYEKKIPKEFWDEALADYPDQSDHILRFLRSRLDDTADEKEIRRATDALLRRGHSYGEIRKALEALMPETDDYSED